MAWTDPKTWSSEPLTSVDLNTYMRDNQNHLKDRLDSGVDSIVSAANEYSTTSTEFVDVSASKLSLALTTHCGAVLLGFTGTVQAKINHGSVAFNVAVDGLDYVADDGITRCTVSFSHDTRRHKPVSFVMLITGLSAGAHTFRLRWKVFGGNTAYMDVVNLHPQFWAKEI